MSKFLPRHLAITRGGVHVPAMKRHPQRTRTNAYERQVVIGRDAAQPVMNMRNADALTQGHQDLKQRAGVRPAGDRDQHGLAARDPLLAQKGGDFEVHFRHAGRVDRNRLGPQPRPGRVILKCSELVGNSPKDPERHEVHSSARDQARPRGPADAGRAAWWRTRAKRPT